MWFYLRPLTTSNSLPHYPSEKKDNETRKKETQNAEIKDIDIHKINMYIQNETKRSVCI